MCELLTVHCPIYLFEAEQECWKCGKSQQVVAIGAYRIEDQNGQLTDPDDEPEMILMSNITGLPLNVLNRVVERSPRYQRQHSKTAGHAYYANTCECGALLGDHYLFSEPGGAFWPETEIAASSIRYQKLLLEGEIQIEASASMGLGDFIVEHAKLIQAA